MPRTCTVCPHPFRSAIDAALAAGTDSLRNMAQRFGPSPTALHRHKQRCLAAAVAVAAAATEALSVEAILQAVHDLNAKTLAVLEKAEAADKGHLVLSAVREARGNLETLTKLVLLAESRAAQGAVAGPGGAGDEAEARLAPTEEEMAEALAILLELAPTAGAFGEPLAAALARRGLAVVRVPATPTGQP